jgi:hypothetical protein
MRQVSRRGHAQQERVSSFVNGGESGEGRRADETTDAVTCLEKRDLDGWIKGQHPVCASQTGDTRADNDDVYGW